MKFLASPMVEFLQNNLLAILTLLGGGVAWWYDRKKRKSELQKEQVDIDISKGAAVLGISEMYKKMIEDTREKYMEQEKRIDDLEAENRKLKEMIMERDRKIAELEKLIKHG